MSPDRPDEEGEAFVYTALHAMVFVAMADGDLTEQEIAGIDLALRRISRAGLPGGDPLAMLRPFGQSGLEEHPDFPTMRDRLSPQHREQILLLSLLIARVSPSGEWLEFQRIIRVAEALEIPGDRVGTMVAEHGGLTVGPRS